MILSALVIGLGQIGMGYDLNLNPETHILTHARAFQSHHDFKLVGGVDPDPKRGALFKKNYDVPSYADIASALEKTRPDVVAIATPTTEHNKSVLAVLEYYKPKAILCEKPLSYDLQEAREIIERSRLSGCHLFTNYMRRSDQGVIEIKRQLDEKIMHSPVKGVAWYSKGLFNNGSHLLNLLQYWLGEVTQFQIIEPGRMWNGCDPEPDMSISFQRGTIVFLATREENYSHYTIELVTPNGRLRYEQGGEKIIWQSAIQDKTCDGYTILDPAEEIIPTKFSSVQWHVVDQLSAALQGRDVHICSGTDALKTLEILTQIQAKL